MNFLKITKQAAMVSLALAATHTFAAPYKDKSFFKDKPVHTCPRTYLMDGFYAGVQANYDTVRANDTLTSFNEPFGITSTYYNTKLGANGWSGGLYLGDGRYFKNIYYLGAEVFGNLSSNFYVRNSANPGNTDTINTANDKLTVGNNYGISIMPGIGINDHSLLYVRLGYKWSNFKYSATTATADAIPVTSSVNTSKILGGFNAGVGMEMYVYDRWSVRGEYTYTNYNSMNVSFANANDATEPYSAKVSPSDSQYSLGVTYHIA